MQIVIDTRTLELAQYHNIPYILSTELNENTSLEALYYRACFDMRKFYDSYDAKLDEYASFLEKNNIEVNPNFKENDYITKDTPEWHTHESFSEGWKGRIKRLSEFIDKDSKTILDLGCGKEWLKEFLDEHKTYLGCDYISRSENTIVCDFNKKQFPNIDVDVCFISSCLEYIYDWKWFLSKVAEKCSCIIMSYVTLETVNDMDERKKIMWVNHIPHSYLIKYIESLGFKLIFVQNINTAMLYKFKKIS